MAKYITLGALVQTYVRCSIHILSTGLEQLGPLAEHLQRKISPPHPLIYQPYRGFSLRQTPHTADNVTVGQAVKSMETVDEQENRSNLYETLELGVCLSRPPEINTAPLLNLRSTNYVGRDDAGIAWKASSPFPTPAAPVTHSSATPAIGQR